MKKPAIVVATLLLAVVVACASIGRQFDRTHVNDIKTGVQTKDTIREWFGEPNQVIVPLQRHPAGCTERWTYVHAYSSYGGLKTESASLVVDFDKHGKVCDHAYSEIKP